MPKGGKRKRGTPDSEVEEAARRMEKYPEHLQSARSSRKWQNFLEGIGITTGKADFWEAVRDKVYIDRTGFTERTLAEQGIVIAEGLYRGVGGKFTSEVTDRPIVSYRSFTTGRFVSKKSIEN